MSQSAAFSDAGAMDIPSAIRQARAGQRVILRQRGRPVAAVVSLRDLRALEKIEDLLDAEYARKVERQMDRSGWKGIPLEQLKKEVGL